MSIVLSAQSGSTLTSVSRLTQNAQLSALNTSNPTLVASLLAGATALIQRVTHRDLISQNYTEYASGGNYPYTTLTLQQFPVTAVSRVATNPQTVLTVINSSSANQRATIATTTGGVTLYRVASGIPTTNTLLYSTYVTVGTLAAAIVALGNGWSASVAGGYNNFASVDLKPLQGAFTTMNGGADLQLYTEELSSNSLVGWSGTDDEEWGNTLGWRLDEGPGTLYGRFPRGNLNVRIDYTAGFTVVPDDLQEACCQLVLDFYNSQLADQTMKSGGLGPYRFERDTMAGSMSEKVRGICSRYIDHARLNIKR